MAHRAHTHPVHEVPTWAEIDRLVNIEANGSWLVSEFGKQWFADHACEPYGAERSNISAEACGQAPRHSAMRSTGGAWLTRTSRIGEATGCPHYAMEHMVPTFSPTQRIRN